MRLWYSFLYFITYRLYAPLHDLYWRIKNREQYYNRPVAFPCDLCGEVGHEPEFCPKAKELGLLRPKKREQH